MALKLERARRGCTGRSCHHYTTHDAICLTCSGKRREDLLDRSEVVEALAVLGVKYWTAEETNLIQEVSELLSIWPAVEKRAKELEEER